MERKIQEREPPPSEPQNCLVYLLSAFCVIIILIHLTAAFFPQGRIWGINQWSYFPPWISLLSGIFVLLFFIPSLNDLARKSISSLLSPVKRFFGSARVFAEKKRYLLYFGLSLLFIIPFWLLRDRTHFLGDGAQIISRMNSGELTIKWTEPLEIFLHIKAFDLANRLWQMDSATLYAILSCLAGVLFVFLIFLLADFWGKEVKEKVFIFLILLGMGSTQLFLGYAEHYSFLYVFIFGFILSSLGYLEGKVGWFVPLAMFVPAFLSHVSSLCLLPPLLFIFFVGSKTGRSSLVRKILILAGGLVCGGLILTVYRIYGWTIPPMFVPLSEDTHAAPGYLLFSLPHIIDFLNQQFLASPVGPAMLLAPLVCMMLSSFFKDRVFRFLLLVCAVQLLYGFAVNPALGAARDWDLFSVVGLGYTVLGLFIFLRLFRDRTTFGYLSLVLVLTSLYGTVPWMVLNSCEQKSIRRFENLLRIDVKKSYSGHFLLIKYFKDHGRKEDAKEQRDEYEQAFPEIVLSLEGARLAKLGEFEKAKELYLRAERYAPKMSDIHGNLGHVYLQLGELDKAEAELKKAIELGPHISTAYENLADLYLLRQEYDLALDACKKAIRLKTESAQTYSNAATIYLMRGGMKQAEAYYRKALSLDWSLVEAYVGLGDIYTRKSMPLQALEMYQTVLKLDPNLALAHYRLGITYLSLNSLEEAKRELELYLRISPQGQEAEKAKEILKQLPQIE